MIIRTLSQTLSKLHPKEQQSFNFYIPPRLTFLPRVNQSDTGCYLLFTARRNFLFPVRHKGQEVGDVPPRIHQSSIELFTAVDSSAPVTMRGHCFFVEKARHRDVRGERHCRPPPVSFPRVALYHLPLFSAGPSIIFYSKPHTSSWPRLVSRIVLQRVQLPLHFKPFHASLSSLFDLPLSFARRSDESYTRSRLNIFPRCGTQIFLSPRVSFIALLIPLAPLTHITRDTELKRRFLPRALPFTLHVCRYLCSCFARFLYGERERERNAFCMLIDF